MSVHVGSYTMRTQHDCGPSAVSFMTGRSYDEVCSAWGWDNHNNIFDDIVDTPFHHFDVLCKLKIPWRIVNCNEILNGSTKPNETAILLHNPKNPTRLQHWAVLAGTFVNIDKVELHMGDGKTNFVTFNQFVKLYSGGCPACAYEINPDKGGQLKLAWWKKLLVKITGVF